MNDGRRKELIYAISRCFDELEDSDAVSFRFWCRPRNIDFLFDMMKGRVPRGKALFICPSNVPIVSAYATAIGIISKNDCLIRIPENSVLGYREATEKMCMEISGSPFSEHVTLVECGHDDPRLMGWSSQSNVRVVWGSDKTIMHIMGWAHPADCLDLPLPSKTSVSIIDMDDVRENLDGCICRFIKDITYQNHTSCICPRGVIWLNYRKDTHDEFWKRISDSVAPYIGLDHAVVSLTDSEILSLKDFRYRNERFGHLHIIDTSDMHEVTDCEFDSYTFVETAANSVEEAIQRIPANTQTVVCSESCIGMIREALDSKNLPSGYRLGLYGRAVSADAVADGNDLLHILTRTRNPDVFN